ncbi:hypothetical protein [Desulfotalea psychrophila]|uniref:Uncharacterized protein n=1 Tax=Desulfotalea psychrophila (strain LSv54 / DSM 12343) TaxID=177439 RepID=Q6ALA7_DESPS|nr:hypothetical protein [Desulfotalea psychrophila]CAG36868.1 unknown protein [Desulfotalea psychrophila LSv54]
MKNKTVGRGKNRLLLNIIFGVFCAGVLAFLLSAPEKSTSPLPMDSDHKRFYSMKKKEAEQYCMSCHGPAKENALSAEHPSKFRCLFCHTRPVQK